MAWDEDLDDPAQGPGGFGRFFRFLVGLVLGLAVSFVVLTYLAVHGPTPSRPAAVAQQAAPVLTRPEGGLEGPAIDVNAAAFAATGGAAPMAIVLEGAGSGSVTPETLLALPMPVTLVIDPALPGGASLAAEARARGSEVLAAVDVSTGAAGAKSAVDTLWMAVGVMPRGPAGGLPEAAALTPVADALVAGGYALVPASAAAAAAVDAAAAAAGLRAGTAPIPIDALADAAAVADALGDAATEAAAAGGAIVVAPANRSVVEGLVAWWQAENGQAVQLAPVSAVIPAAGASAQ